MGNRFEDASKRAAQKTDEELSKEISQLTNLPSDRCNALFPTETDKNNLKELISIVNSATSENDRVNKLKEKIETCGSVVLKLLKEYTRPLG